MKWLPLKGIASAKKNDFHGKEWPTLDEMVSTKRNAFP